MTISGLAHYGVQYDAWRFHLLHFAGAFIDYTTHTFQHPVCFTAIGNHLRIPCHAPILAICVERLQNLFMGFHAHEVTRLEIERH